MTQLFIIADDLTGALDTGVQLAKQGIPTRVIPFFVEDIVESAQKHRDDVMIFNTESRHIDPEIAAIRVSRIVESGKQFGITHFYKKTDSTMRGNIGAELGAFLNASGQESILFVPAHPRLKRFTKEGFHFIDDTLLHETEFGDDPLEPIGNSYIPELLGAQTNLPVQIADTRKQNIADPEPRINVFDCQSEADLQEIGAFALANDLANYLAGSAALAEYLPKLFRFSTMPKAEARVPSPILLVNGSMNSISAKQIKYAETQGWKNIRISINLFSSSNEKFEDFCKHTSTELHAAFSEQKNVLLSTSELVFPIDEEFEHSGSNTNDHHVLLADRIGQFVFQMLKVVSYPTLIIFGGDTTLGIMKALGCHSIIPISEIVPGVALSMARLESGTLHLITKPGGYGEEDEISKINDYIRKQKE